MFKPAKAAEIVLSFDHAQVTTDTTWKFFHVPAGRRFRVRKAEYINPTGLAADDTNYEVLKLKNGSTVLASWSTKTTGGSGALTADTFTELAQSATDADLVLAAGDVLAFMADAGGSPTLPAGRLVVHGWLI